MKLKSKYNKIDKKFVIGIAFNWLGIDMANWQSLAVEKTLIESFLPVEVTVPESSFIDMLVALSVLPIATFTTITVLGGGAIAVPRWMQDPASKLIEMNPTKKEENIEQIQPFSSLQSTSTKEIIEDKNLISYKGNYTEFEKEKEKRVLIFWRVSPSI